MKRSHNTIRLEIKAGLVDGIYEPEVGERKAKILRKRSKTQLLKLIQEGELRKEVEPSIRKKISPRRISGGLKKKGVILSDKSIYKFIEAYSLEHYLCFKGKERKRQGHSICTEKLKS